MPKITEAVFIVAVTALAVAAGATGGSAKSVDTYRATLASGTEVPKPKGAVGAKGLFTATVTDNDTTRTLAWKLTFSRLSGKAVAAHIHKGKAGVAGGVLVALCGPCASGKTGRVKISSDVADLLERGLAYINVHTAKNAAGEVRGQVKLLDHAGTSPAPQPEPTPTTPTPTEPPSIGY